LDLGNIGDASVAAVNPNHIKITTDNRNVFSAKRRVCVFMA